MKIGIMQPYFFPYIGYFQLIDSVDLFVLYDNIKYTKKGWINRNRLLRGQSDFKISLPLAKESDSLDVRDRSISSSFDQDKLLNQIKEAYRKAPNFASTYSLVSEIIQNEERNLFQFLYSSLRKTCDELGIATKILVSSEIDIDHDLKGQQKVLAICKAVGGENYVNAIGGQQLYSKEDFSQEGLGLHFIHSHIVPYAQYGNTFVSGLSIIDVMMFNSSMLIMSQILPKYELI